MLTIQAWAKNFTFYKTDTIAVIREKDKCGVAQSKLNIWSEMCQLDTIIILTFGRALYAMDVSEIPRT